MAALPIPTEVAPAPASTTRQAGSSQTLPVPAKRVPSDSYLELIFPFSSSAQLREHYQRFTSNQMRFGLLLEDLDTLAGGWQVAGWLKKTRVDAGAAGADAGAAFFCADAPAQHV